MITDDYNEEEFIRQIQKNIAEDLARLAAETPEEKAARRAQEDLEDQWEKEYWDEHYEEWEKCAYEGKDAETICFEIFGVKRFNYEGDHQ